MLGKVLFTEFVYNFQINNYKFLNEKLELTLVFMIFYFKVLWLDWLSIYPNEDFSPGKEKGKWRKVGEIEIVKKKKFS